jgi:hypothetical protein
MKNHYMQIPYEAREVAKKQGAKWNPKFKKWFIEGPLTQEQEDALRHWLPVSYWSDGAPTSKRRPLADIKKAFDKPNNNEHKTR